MIKTMGIVVEVLTIEMSKPRLTLLLESVYNMSNLSKKSRFFLPGYTGNGYTLTGRKSPPEFDFFTGCGKVAENGQSYP